MVTADPASLSLAPVPVPAPTDAARALIAGQMAVLTRLTEIGMEIAEACGRDARAAVGDGSAPASPLEIVGVFARVARAVRMTIALQSRLMKDLAVLDRADELAAMRRKDDRRFRLSRLVDQAARAGVEARRDAGLQRWADEDAVEDEIERLASEAYERLKDAEDGDFEGLSFDEAVAAICADLSLSPEWTARVSRAVAAPASTSSPTTAVVAGGGPSAAEPMVEGVGQERRGQPQHLGPCPTTTRSSAGGPPPPLLRSG